jgi:uncharacterized protein YndB with AHSA1/START domain
VYRAHTHPKLIQKWLLGPDGWTMPVCFNEAKPGGNEWTDGKDRPGSSDHGGPRKSGRGAETRR